MSCCDDSPSPIPSNANPYGAAVLTESPDPGDPFAVFHTVGENARKRYIRSIRINNPSSAVAKIGVAFSILGDGVGSAWVDGQPLSIVAIPSISRIETAWTTVPTPNAVYLVQDQITAEPGATVEYSLPIMMPKGGVSVDLGFYNLDTVAGPPLNFSMVWYEEAG